MAFYNYTQEIERGNGKRGRREMPRIGILRAGEGSEPTYTYT